MKKSVFNNIDKTLLCLISILLFSLLNSSAAQNPIFPNPADWDTTRIYAGSGTLQKIAIGNHLKEISDDTFRIATGQSPLNRNAIILTDTSTTPPMQWRVDIPFTGAGNNGVVSIAIGDVDADGMNEIIFGQAGGNLIRVKWDGSSWEVTQIDSQGTAVYDIDIDDADNNGAADIIFARYNYVFRTYWTGSSWQTDQIWSGDASLCQGVAIGDFDSSFSGNEIVAVTAGGKAVRIRWTGLSWENYIMYDNSICSFYDPAIGDFDSSNLGNEIVFGNGNATINNGSVIELFGSGNSWSTQAIYTPTGTNESHQNLAVGDVLDENPGSEIVSIGLRSNADSIRVFYGSGINWIHQTVIGFPQTQANGIAIGDINKYRSRNHEFAFARNTILYEVEQRLPPGPTINNISHSPIIPLFNETVTVKAKILDTLTIIADSLYYAINSPSNWQSVTHFNLDSFYYYAIPAQDTGTFVYYFVKAKNSSNGETQSSIFSYQVAYEHSIYQIQYSAGPSDTSPDNNKYIHTRGIATGVFGRYFNIEEEPGGAWHGIHIQRPAFSDTLPNLTIGDSVTVLGRVMEYLNQTVINVFYDSGGRTQLISSAHPLPCTTIARIPQIAESLEGALVRIDTVRYKNTGYFQSNTSYWIYNFTETESLICFIRSKTDIPNESIPTGYLLLTGNLNQYVNNYQIVPRTITDLNLLLVDFGAIEILAPADTVDYGGNIIPKVIISNYQMTPVKNLSVWLYIGTFYNNEYFFSKLSPQQFDTVEFAPWSADTGQHQITAYTKLQNDLNPQNDTIFRSVYVRPSTSPARWEPIANIPIEPSGKRPKSGSCMVGFEPTGKIYFLKASNTQDFYSYTPDEGVGIWTTADTIPIGTKEAGDGKKPKSGAAMTSFENTVYVLRGNNTIGFWQYQTDTTGVTFGWTKLKNIPLGLKKCKYGSGLTAVSKNGNDYIFAMKGAKTSEFYFYDIAHDSWIQVTSPPIGSSGKAGYKKGSCLAYDAGSGLVYVLQGYYGSFFSYCIEGDSWHQLRQYNYKVFLNRDGKKKKPKDGAGLVYYDNNLYLLKGGNTNEVWKYSVAADSWMQMETAEAWDIPTGPANKKVKDGGGMIKFGNYFYASKGKNTAEFYRHSVPTTEIVDHRLKDKRFEDYKINPQICNLQSSNQFDLTITPNPATNTFAVKYNLTKAGPVNFKLYNVAGVLVKSYTSSNIINNGVVLIDTKTLSSCIYILKFSSEKMNVIRKVVIEK